MSDPRFARLKSDPRFRKIKKHEAKVVVDDRFKSIFDDDKKSKSKKGKGRVDKYGRPISASHEQDSLRRFYRLENEDQPDADAEPEAKAAVPDYARGAVLLESSDEEDDNDAQSDDGSDTGGIITLGRDITQPISVLDDGDIDLDENNFADLDAQAAAYAKANPTANDHEAPDVAQTRRIAVVNLDWDHVRAIHLYRIVASLVSPTAPPAVAVQEHTNPAKSTAARVVRGKVLSVRVYPSQFGKERMAREETEGPPAEVFKKSHEIDDPEEVNERNIYETGGGEDYDEDALRRYQLERLRYYYAIVECDTVEAAAHIFTELEGTELERSANVFDLSFVPNDMTFDDEFRDEATEDVNAPYKGLDFVTDALRHSKVKLTWDEDDVQRNQITRRPLSRKEIEENDFRAYIASSTSGSEAEDNGPSSSKSKKLASRDRLRDLLLGGNDDEMPEGWGNDDDHDVDMEITFTPGLSDAKDAQDETTLEKYQRKMKEKRKKHKTETKEKESAPEKSKVKDKPEDDFFAVGSDDDVEAVTKKRSEKGKGKGKGKKPRESTPEPVEHHVSTAEELALIAASDNPNGDPKHFNMKAVLKAEKAKGRKKKGKKGKETEGENELQEDFNIDVKDERFKAVLEDHTYAIDPSNPHFKKTKSMSALLDERSKRQKRAYTEDPAVQAQNSNGGQKSLQSLVESVKRKSSAVEQGGVGKRQKL